MREWRKEVEQRLHGAGLDGGTEREIVEELAQHLEDRYDELRAQGMPPGEAREQALAELGNDHNLAKHVSGVVSRRPETLPVGLASGESISGWWSDLRFGVRMLLRAPWYTTVSVLVVGIGIGANTVTFTGLDYLLFRPPTGVADPHELARVYTSDQSGPLYGASSYVDYEVIAAEPNLFQSVAVRRSQIFGIATESWEDAAQGEIVSANYFEVLGILPVVGRFFAADEAGAGKTSRVVVIGHDFWQTHFTGSRDVVGSTVRINGEPLTVIGIAPRDFGGVVVGDRAELWVTVSAPASLTPGVNLLSRGDRGFSIFARLRDRETVETVRPRLNVLASRLHDAFPGYWTDINDRPRVLSILPEVGSRIEPDERGIAVAGIGLLIGAVVIVLLVACTNVANLTLARAFVRRSEMGVRIALGASRGRIIRHVLAESLILAAMGGMLGVLLTFLFTRRLQANLDMRVDLRVLTFAALVTLLTSVVVGLAPALQASRAPAPSLKGAGPASGCSRGRSVLVVVQVACSLVLLVGGSLFIRSLLEMHSIDSGFDADDVVVMRFNLRLQGYPREQTAAFYEEILARARGLPGTSSVALARRLPLGPRNRRSIFVEGYERQPGESMEMANNGVTSGYFETMGLEVRSGRAFTPQDREGAPPVAMVSEAFAGRYWPGQNALGKRVSFDGADGPFAEVIGIAADAKYYSLTEQPQPAFYYPYAQRPDEDMALLVRSAADTDVVMSSLRSAVQGIDPDLRPGQLITFGQHVESTTSDLRLAAALLTALGVFAIFIALIGLYGLVAFSVWQRSREFGLRMALGAAASDVRRLVLGQALRLVLVGIACGIPVAAVGAMLGNRFLMVSPVDPVAFLVVPALLAACGVLASYSPARRATRQDPAQALRAE